MHNGSGPRTPDFDEAVDIWTMLLSGMFQHDIAAVYGFNQGRISEVRTGKRHPGSHEAALRRLRR